ncbi:hypothetical protein [Paenibacillus agilis]|uniref:Uncharacterized protein n=1 Tax=Paenibacillus agilis TaxID=3020863 RepID=A0A559IXA6_9BACL|nr:hypothetical protein [Paenibacillus agilis]TVX92264.1 hypothetical protein FPZ44_03815 [Paenibacillus agilis]
MDRQERKRREREIAAYDNRKTFVQPEIIQGNYLAYEAGIGHALDAAAARFGIGDVRVARFQEKLNLVQKADGIGDGAAKKPGLDEAAAKFDAIYKFSKESARNMNIESYKVAVDHIRDAIPILYGLGGKRMAEYEETLHEIQAADNLAQFMQDGNPHRLKYNRALRREKETAKNKEAVDKLVRP